MTIHRQIIRIAAVAAGIGLSAPAFATPTHAAAPALRAPGAVTPKSRLAGDDARIATDRARIRAATRAGVHAWLAADIPAFEVILYARERATADLHRDLRARRHDQRTLGSAPRSTRG